MILDVHTPASPEYSRRIANVTPRTLRNARVWAHGTAADLGCDPDPIELAISELVTNVARYAAGPAQVRIALIAAGIEVSCTDRHPETAADVRPAEDMFGDDDATTHRGLFMLALMATGGVQVQPLVGRKRVLVVLPIGGAE